MSSTPLLLLGLGASAYYLYNQQKNTGVSDQGNATAGAKDDSFANSCPEGYLLSDDGQNCNLIDDGTTPDPSSPCGEGYVISEDGTQCLPLNGNPCGSDEYKLSEDGQSCVAVNPCGEGFIQSADGKECLPTGNPCGDPCFKFENETCNRIPNCGSATGSDIGDQFLYLGESIVAGEIYDFIGRRVMSVADRQLAKQVAKEASEKLAKETAEKTAKKFAEALAKKTAQEAEEAIAKRTAREVARKALQSIAQREAGEILAKRAGSVMAKRLGIEALTIAGKKLATKMAVMVAKINAQNATGIGVVLSALTAIAISLTMGLAIAGVTFEKDSPDDWDWDNLPEGARVALEALPLFGDIISIISPFIAFKTGCQAGTQNENGLCYEPPKEGWSCEAFLCTPNSSTYGFNPLSETKLHMTKRIELDTGTIPDTAPAGMTKDGAFAYWKPDWASNILAGVAWEGCRDGFTDTGIRCEDVYGGGVGTIPLRKGCGDFGDITNCRDDGTSLWSDWKCNTWSDPIVCDPVYWDGCCSRGLFGECWGCARGGGCRGGEVHTNCSGSGSIVKALWDLQYCGDGKEMLSGLCYDKCRDGYTRDGLLCTRSYTKRSEVLAPHTLECPNGRSTNIAGLCYENPIREGYERQSLGLLSQKAPADKEEWKSYPMFYGTVDIGVSYQKASYTRKPYPLFSVYGKRKYEPPPPPPDPPLPSLCSSLTPRAEGFVLTEENREVCRVTDCGAESELSGDGLYCIKKCNTGYEYNFSNKACEKILDDGTKDSYDNSAGVFEVEYDYH